MSGLRIVASGPALWSAVGVAMVLLVLALALEWRRWRGVRRAVRGALIVTATAALFLICVGLSTLRLLEDEGEAVLWTEGVEPGAVAGLPLESAPVYALFGRAETAPPDAVWVADATALERRAAGVSGWHVLGAGLAAWEWAEMTAGVASFTAGVDSTGFTRAAWNRQLTRGSELVVSGEVETLGGSGAVTLVGAGGELARLELPAGGAFELRHRPRRVGRFVFRLRWEGSDGAQLEELVDAEVRAARPLRLLWLESAPAFETRHFKSWFAATGGELAIRTSISRRRERREFFGREPDSLESLQARQLAELDVLVADARWLEGLARSEASILRAAVRDGLGLLVRDLPRESRRLRSFEELRIAPLAEAGDLEARLRRPGGGRTTALTLPAREIVPTAGLRPVLMDAGERVLAGVWASGRGRVAVSLVEDSYRWVLAGAEAFHREVWTTLVEAVARRRDGGRWSIRPGPVLVDEPLTIWLAGERQPSEASVTMPDGRVAPLALRSEPGEVERWSARLHPTASGWYRVAEAGHHHWFYVADGSSWRSWQRRRNRDDTERRQALSTRAAAPLERAAERRIPLSPVLPFSLFVLAAGALWLDDRRAS